MSHDGSSCRSYIKHPTEKERLDNLAFTSFPEDYLPYASAYHQGRGGKAPYLVWEEHRGPARRRRKRCCTTTALVSAVALIVAAIMAVVAISVYLGVVTNLFRSPVLSLSGRFRIREGDVFSESLLNTTSYQFLTKAETYQAMVENAFLSSSLEPAFIASRIYAFRPGLLVFFRVYLDRRKLRQDDSSTVLLVEEKLREQNNTPNFSALLIDPESVEISENEDWLTVPEPEHRSSRIDNENEHSKTSYTVNNPLRTSSAKDDTTQSVSTTKLQKTTSSVPESRPTPTVRLVTARPPTLPPVVPLEDLPDTGTGQVIAVGPINPEDDTLHYSYGHWRPVAIDDAVIPSFRDQRTPPGRGSVRLLDNVQNNQPMGVGTVKVLDDPLSHVDPIPMQKPPPEKPTNQPAGGVASTIMSSVSLVILPGKKNQTDQSQKVSERKDHASYRILEEDESFSESATDADYSTTEATTEFSESKVEYSGIESKVEYSDESSIVDDEAPLSTVEIFGRRTTVGNRNLDIYTAYPQSTSTLHKSVFYLKEDPSMSFPMATETATFSDSTEVEDTTDDMDAVEDDKDIIEETTEMESAQDSTTETTTSIRTQTVFDSLFSTIGSTVEDATTTTNPNNNDSSDLGEPNLEHDIHSTIVNFSQYPTLEPTIMSTEKNNTPQDVFDGHTGLGHGFHHPNNDSAIGPDDSDKNQEASNDSNVVVLGIAKIVPQLSNRHTNDIDSEDIFNGVDQGILGAEKVTDLPSFNEGSREEGDIIRHVTTHVPIVDNVSVEVGKNTLATSQSCSEDQIECNSGECIHPSQLCNMRRDCRDNSDERNCSCADHLKVMGQSQKICDGIQDCRDRTDEMNCPWCEKGQFICHGHMSKMCINESKVCDGNNDCPYGTDEKYCVKLADNVSSADDFHYQNEGFLMVRKGGQWGKLCADNLQDTTAVKRKIDELGSAVCNALTYSEPANAVRYKDSVEGEEFYYKISSNQTTREKRQSSAIFRPAECPSHDVIRVKCGSLDCGLRPLATSSRRRIVGGQSADSGSWPWQVALYKEGDFQCGAVLVSDIWLVSAGHCFFRTQTAHWTARMGLLRRGSELPSPAEETRRIAKMILHPDYIDEGFINDIALLRLDKPVPFSDYLRPLCLPRENEESDLWHGRQCSVVGWGKLFERGHTFPDSLQEVRLPVIATEECRKKILFLTMYHITDNMFCAGYERGGRDACLGDSGGPLMCQRQDGGWILLGVTSNGDGCGRPRRPGVYTKVTRYLPWLHKVMDENVAVPPFRDSCEGVRCPLGRCVPPYRVCDARWDCSDGSDEDHCLA